MSEKGNELLISIDVKKCRFRIHRPVLNQLDSPKRVQLLFNSEQYGIMVMKIGANVPISQSLKVAFDKPGSDGTFELYSATLMRDLQKWDKRLETKSLFHIYGHCIPELEAICFPLNTLVRANDLSVKG